MWELGSSWAQSINSTPMASIHTMVHEFHVLLVDHVADTLIYTRNQLQACHYRVSYAEAAHVAIPMLLSNENAKFDVVMITIHDPNGFKLLQHALNINIPVVWMSDDDNTSTTMRALESGAFLCIKKPPPMEFLQCLWQHVVRERIRMMRGKGTFVATNNLGPVRGVHQPNPNSYFMVKNKGKYLSQLDGYDEEYGYDNSIVSQDGVVKRKMCTEWTQELHAKFMDVVERLGEGRCFPKDILEMMNEPGLTRMQVASHLQKCRNDNWRSPQDKKAMTNQTAQQSLPTNARTSKPRKFGSMPLPYKPSSVQIHMETGQSSETRTSINATNMGHGSSSMTNNAPQQYETNDYFNFPDVDSLIHDFTGQQSEPENNNPNPIQPAYQVDHTYNNEQNSGETSAKDKSH